jgi:hypothetical protein
MITANFRAWTTERELEFLMRLGKEPLRAHANAPGFTRAELLEGYFQAFPKRVRWTGVDSYIILEYLHKAIKEGQHRSPVPEAKPQPLVIPVL